MKPKSQIPEDYEASYTRKERIKKNFQNKISPNILSFFNSFQKIANDIENIV